jgi:hypothetical protein
MQKTRTEGKSLKTLIPPDFKARVSFEPVSSIKTNKTAIITDIGIVY